MKQFTFTTNFIGFFLSAKAKSASFYSMVRRLGPVGRSKEGGSSRSGSETSEAGSRVTVLQLW